MYNSKKGITYVFGAGRLNKLNSDSLKAEEFFYGYQYFAKKIKDLKIIEMEFPINSNNKILEFVDKVLRKITQLPIYTKDILFVKNYNILKNTQKLILTTDLLALSMLPFLVVVKIFHKIDIFVIVMGLFGRQPKNRAVKIFQNIFIGILNKVTKCYVFLGRGEYSNAVSMKPKNSNKFRFLPFCIDTKFWKANNSDLINNKDGILFIGNDGKRDYKLVEKIAKSLPEINFTFITSQIKEVELKNVNLIKGSWGENLLSDEEIRKYYQNSKLTIIPLIETYQPSGQSVALQSMSCGTPVMISETKGFWDKEKFIHDENIVFIKNNDLGIWVNEIKKYYFNEDYLKKISITGISTINDEFNLSSFNSNLEKIIYQ